MWSTPGNNVDSIFLAFFLNLKIPEINVSFFGLNSAGFSDYPTINSDSDIGGLESCYRNIGRKYASGETEWSSCRDAVEVFSYLTLIIEIQG